MRAAGLAELYTACSVYLGLAAQLVCQPDNIRSSGLLSPPLALPFRQPRVGLSAGHMRDTVTKRAPYVGVEPGLLDIGNE